MAYVSESKTFDQASNLLTHGRNYYDDLVLGQVKKGNLTAQELWLDTGNQWLRSQTAYDDYGMPVSSTNPRGFSSQTIYDFNHLYPVTFTNAKGHTTQMT